MSGRPHIKITESVENLRGILKQPKKIRSGSRQRLITFSQEF